MPCATPDLDHYISLVHGLLCYGLLAVNLVSSVTSRAFYSLVSASKDNELGKSSLRAGAGLGRRRPLPSFWRWALFGSFESILDPLY
jgi:hypothetical protein